MTDNEETKVEDTEEVVEEPKAEEISVNVDLSEINKKLSELTNQISELQKVKEQEVSVPEVEETPAEEPKDETKGEVGEVETEDDEVDEKYTFERADSGKGFAISRDYTKEGQDSELKRLIR